MKHILTMLLGVLLLTAPTLKADVAGFGTAENFNSGWKFTLAADTLQAQAPAFDDSRWRQVNLPHDWSIEGTPSPTLASCTGYLPGGIGWYRKTFSVTDGHPLHYIYFEGVYNRSDVWINGHHLGHRPNGYVSFAYDLTPYLTEGENTLAVRVDHSRYADSRWYTGSGIYRDCWLVAAPESHFALWGIGWEAMSITSRKAVVAVKAEIENIASGMTVRCTLIDPASGLAAATWKGKAKALTEATLTVNNPRIWDLDSPNLYNLKVELLDGKGNAVDQSECRIGLRTLAFDPDSGFSLNGRNTKVKGVCIHHDAGALGAAVPPDVWRRRLENLKSLGVNAIRMSHNPQAPAVYDLCDELGLLVMDEVSDEWEFPKRKWIEGWNQGTPGYDGTFDFFEEWIERDVADIVRRDRTHPCIFLWSIGNEVDYPNDPYSHPILDTNGQLNQPIYGGYNPEAPRAERIGEIAKRLAAVVKSIDTSRPTTGALAGVVMSNQTAYPEAVDLTGYNYTENRYAEDHAAYPSRIIYGSENGAGFDAWKAVRDNQYIFGQFIWTGLDYLGEASRWPSRGLHTGLLDFKGTPKPRGLFRASLWSDSTVAYIGTARKQPQRPGGRGPGGNRGPSMDSEASWNYDEGDVIMVGGFTNAPYARLLLNGIQVGDILPYNDTTGIMVWELPWQPGTLRLEALDADGNVAASHQVVTTGRPYALRARLDNPATGGVPAVHHVIVEVVDEAGNVVNLADNQIQCRVTSGDASLLAIENGDNTDMSANQQPVAAWMPRGNGPQGGPGMGQRGPQGVPAVRQASRRAYRGSLLAYVKPQSSAEAVALEFSSPLLQKASLTINP